MNALTRLLFGTDLAAAAGVQYSIRFVNNSTNAGDVCVFQDDPNLGVPNVMPLAWFSKYTYPGTIVTFRWTIDYTFVWAETGPLTAGVIFDAAQSVPADLSTLNQITLTYLNGYNFIGLGKGPTPGTLFINEDATVPLKQASIGIGMSGAGTFAVQAQPNMKLTFTPHPRYWITFGTFIAGQVLDVGQITDKAEIAFPPGVYAMTATLGMDNTWNVAPTAQMNAQFLEARSRQGALGWGQRDEAAYRQLREPTRSRQ